MGGGGTTTARSRLVNKTALAELGRDTWQGEVIGYGSTRTRRLSRLAVSACRWSNYMNIGWRVWLLLERERDTCAYLTYPWVAKTKCVKVEEWRDVLDETYFETVGARGLRAGCLSGHRCHRLIVLRAVWTIHGRCPLLHLLEVTGVQRNAESLTGRIEQQRRLACRAGSKVRVGSLNERRARVSFRRRRPRRCLPSKPFAAWDFA